jgi:tetratricopeptide (TPR) repeat protein
LPRFRDHLRESWSSSPPRANLLAPRNEPPREPSTVYSILLCAAAGLLLGFSGTAFGIWGWGWSIFFSFVVFAVAWVIFARWLGRRLQPAMARVHQQMQAGMVDAAMQSLQALRPMGKWVPLLEGQLVAQMGVLAYHAGDQKKAIGLLEKASIRMSDAQVLLAAIHHRNGESARALQLLKLAALAGKKHALLQNTYAWMLHKAGRDDEAQAVLAKFLQKDPGNAPAKENMLRLQNRQRMTMKSFGMVWYTLGLEQPPPEFGQLRPARKGFRTPPKQRGK